MPTLIETFVDSELTVRYRSPQGSAAVNAKHAVSVAPGTYRGFRLATHASDNTITVVADPAATDHVAVYLNQTSGGSLTVRRTGGDFAIDLASLVDAGEKTWIIAIYAPYQVGFTTTGVVRAYELDPSDEFTIAAEKGDLVVLGKVVIPAGSAAPIPSGNITHDERTFAWSAVAKEAVAWAPLIRNYDFEWSDDNAGNELIADASLYWERDVVGTDNWITDTTNFDKGTRALAFTYSGAGTPSVEVYQHVHLPVSTGQLIKLKAKKRTLQTSTAGGAELFVELTDEDGASAVIYPVAINLASIEGSFSLVEGYVEVPAGKTQVTRVGVRTNGISFGSGGLGFSVDSVQSWLEVLSIDDLDIDASSQGIVAAHKLALLDHADPDQGLTPGVGFLEYDSATNRISLLDKDGNNPAVVTGAITATGESQIGIAAGPAWADGTTNPAERVDQRVDSIVNDLATGAGAAKILTAAGPAWKDATTNPIERVDQRLDSIVTDLVADAGAARVGAAATTDALITAGSIQAALQLIEDRFDRNDYHAMPLEGANPITLTTIGGAAAWTWSDAAANDAPHWRAGGSAQVLIIPCPIVSGAVTITEWLLFGTSPALQVNANLVQYVDAAGLPTRVIKSSVALGTLGGFGSALGVTGLSIDSGSGVGRYAIEVYNTAVAGTYVVHHAMLRWKAKF